MIRPEIFKRIEPRRPSPPNLRPPRRIPEGLTLKIVLTLAALQVCLSGLFLAWQCFGQTPIAMRAIAAFVLLAVAIVQGKLALKALKSRQVSRAPVFRRRSFLRSLFVGLAVSYALALCYGPHSGAVYVFISVLSVWVGVMLLPIAANPKVLEIWKRLSQAGAPRRTSIAVYACVLIAVGTELSLRATRWISEWTPHRPVGFATAGMLGEAGGIRYDGDSRFHVAIVGDEMTLGGIHNDGALSQLEVLTPGVRVTNFSAPTAGPRQYASELAERVVACRPDLVLTFVSVGDDMLAESGEFDWFDWRSLELGRWVQPVVQRFAGDSQTKTQKSPVNQSQFLQWRGAELAVCHTPVDRGVENRWTNAIGHLDRLVGACQRSQVALALVVVPSDFQLNPVLLETLRRRAGYTPQEVDLDLPQRRLATFAAERQVPCIDLLPYLRRCDEPPYERHHRQWNAEGTAVALRTVGGWLQSQYGDLIVSEGQITGK